MKSHFPRSIARQLGLSLLLIATPAFGQAVFNVTSTADDGAVGTLRYAITESNLNAGSTINFSNNLGTVTLGSALPIISTSVTINGGTGNAISGNKANRIFFVDTSTSTAAVKISNLALVDGRAAGGRGGAGGGGGGLGAGGAIFVNSGAVTISGVVFTDNSVKGGNGANGVSSQSVGLGGGGGGGLGGNGGSGSDLSGGGGGGYGGTGGSARAGTGGGGGLIAAGGSGTPLTPHQDRSQEVGGGGGGLTIGGNANGTTSGAAGIGGGNGGSLDSPAGNGSLYGGGGGGSAGTSFSSPGGNGGKFGGGGGGGSDASSGGAGGDFGGGGGGGKNRNGVQANPTAGNGGYGGGGGGGGGASLFPTPSDPSAAGDGGFGGGGGGGAYVSRYDAPDLNGHGGLLGGDGGGIIPSSSGSGGLAATGTGGGGGGGAAGGAIFVRSGNGATLTLIDSTLSGGGAVRGSAGYNDTSAIVKLPTYGTAAGTGIFLDGGMLQWQVTTNETVHDTISDAAFQGGMAAGINKTGAGKLTLTGENTYAGGTILTAGTLAMGSVGALGSTGTISFKGGTLQYNDSVENWTDNSSRFSQAANQSYRIETQANSVALATSLTSVGGTLTKLGAGTLTLLADSTYTGATTISKGTLDLGGNSRSSSFDLASGSRLKLTAGSTAIDFGSATNVVTFTGTGTILKVGSGTTRWGATSAVFNLGSGSLIDVENGTFVGGSFGNEVWTNNRSGLTVVAGALFNGAEANVRVDALNGNGRIVSGFDGTQLFTFGVDNGSGTFSGVLSNNAGRVGHYAKEGTGTQVLSGDNTFTGNLLVKKGTLMIGNGVTGSIVNKGTTSVSSGATLAFNAAPGAVYNNDITNSGTIAGAESSGVTNTLSGVIGGAGRFTQSGTGTTILAANNTYSGGTEITAGTLVLGKNSRSPSFAIGSGATLNLSGGSDNVNFGSATDVVTFTGTGTLLKTGANSARWGGASAVFNLGSGSLIQVDEGTFVGGSNNNEVWTNNLSGLTVATGARFNGVEANVRVDALNGGGQIYSGYDDTQTFTFGVNNGTGTFSGVLADNGNKAGSYVKVGTGTQILSGLNTYTGRTEVDGGTLSVSKLANAGVASGLGASARTQDKLVLNGGTLQYTGTGDSTNRSMTLGAAGGTLDASGTGAVNFTSGASLAFSTSNVAETLTLTGDSIAANTFAAAIHDNGTGLTSVVKNGTGTWHLTGNNDYTGGTMINQGHLEVKGNLTGTVSLQYNTSLHLGSGSTVTGNVLLNGGMIGGSGRVTGKIDVGFASSTYPGDPQILTAGSVSYGTGSTAQFAVETTPDNSHPPVAGTDYDRINLTDRGTALEIQAGVRLQLNLTETSLATLQGTAGNGDIYFLFALNQGSSTGQFEVLTLTEGATKWSAELVDGVAEFDALNLAFNLNYEAGPGGHDLAFTVTHAEVVPEPSTWMLLVLAVGGLIWYRKRLA